MAAKKRRADMTEEERRKQTEAATRKNAIFETAEEFEEAIRGYFDYCDLNDILYNDAGMCLWLSDHNKKGRKVTLQTLERWWDGTSCPYLQESTQLAYLRWQNQFFTNPVYLSKNGVSLSVFMQKQKRLGGRKDRTDANIEQTVNVNFGKNMDANDFK